MKRRGELQRQNNTRADGAREHDNVRRRGKLQHHDAKLSAALETENVFFETLHWLKRGN